VEVTVDFRPRASRLARARPWIAVIVAAIIFALIPLLGLRPFLVVTLLGGRRARGLCQRREGCREEPPQHRPRRRGPGLHRGADLAAATDAGHVGADAQPGYLSISAWAMTRCDGSR
jgi:hypothetical protein